jgi:hypothetical protein
MKKILLLSSIFSFIVFNTIAQFPGGFGGGGGSRRSEQMVIRATKGQQKSQVT